MKLLFFFLVKGKVENLKNSIKLLGFYSFPVRLGELVLLATPGGCSGVLVLLAVSTRYSSLTKYVVGKCTGERREWSPAREGLEG